jgi:glycerate kinase
MDLYISSFADKVKEVIPTSDKNAPGSGAAGGLGFAFMSFLKAEMKSGIEVVTSLTGLEREIETADIIVTGEGRLDSQTAMGKAPVGVAALAKKHGKKVIAFSGCVTRDAEALSEYGIDAFFPILRSVTSLEEAMDTENAYANLKDSAVQVFRLIKTIGELK